jgi:hypothetical protein
MTEVKWLASQEALAMLRSLGKKASGRKLRLFAAACVRRQRIWDLLADERSREAVELAERYADRQATRKELQAAEQQARAAAHSLARYTGGPLSDYAAAYAALAATEAAAYTAPRAASQAAYFVESLNRRGAERSQTRASPADLLREVFGNPFRPVRVAPTWLAWDGGTVPKLAQAIYDERAFDRLPVLADALEEAGCTDRDLLSHCRRPAEHVRGCWAVDLLLGKA